MNIETYHNSSDNPQYKRCFLIISYRLNKIEHSDNHQSRKSNDFIAK